MNALADTADRYSWIPRGSSLDESAFVARHRVLLIVFVAQLPVIAAIGLVEHHGGWMLWGQLPVAILLGIASVRLVSRAYRAAALSLALMICADSLVYAGGGLTDLHIWFYVMLALVALYQMWAPFLLAIVFVAVHHLGMTYMDPMSVFSDPRAQRNPLPYVLLHAFFLVVMAVVLAIGWRFAEQAEAGRVEERRRADAERASQLEVLADQRTEAAAAAAERLEERELRASVLADRLEVLGQAGGRLSQNVSTATSVMAGLRSAIGDIASAASMASSTAQDANDRSVDSAATMTRLSETMSEIEQIAGSIAAIAEQTNLLALNATIEAARAGETGRGFAVVANEVKELASETAGATAQIRRVVESVRADVEDAVTSIGQIRDVMQEVVAAQDTISAAVEEQTSGASEATVAIQGAAEEAARMADDMRAVLTDAR
jgi:hypothetical protein